MASAARDHYAVDGSLAYAGRGWPVSVEGTMSGWVPSADRVAGAVHEGIAKAAAACRGIIASSSPPATAR